MAAPAPAPAAYHYAAPKIAPNVASGQLLFDDPLQFWTIFSDTMNENPPPKNEIAVVLPEFRYLGIELGRPWKPEKVNPAILRSMKESAAGIGKLMLANVAIGGGLANGWVIPPANVGMPGADYLTRAIVAVLGLTANTAEQAIYYTGLLDATGEALTGAKRYTITFAEPMTYMQPVPPGFWSLTMYDDVTKLTVPNEINRYSLGGGDTIERNADGSFTLIIQRENPGKDRESNWLPAPAGPFLSHPSQLCAGARSRARPANGRRVPGAAEADPRHIAAAARPRRSRNLAARRRARRPAIWEG